MHLHWYAVPDAEHIRTLYPVPLEGVVYDKLICAVPVNIQRICFTAAVTAEPEGIGDIGHLSVNDSIVMVVKHLILVVIPCIICYDKGSMTHDIFHLRKAGRCTVAVKGNAAGLCSAVLIAFSNIQIFPVRSLALQHGKVFRSSGKHGVGIAVQSEKGQVIGIRLHLLGYIVYIRRQLKVPGVVMHHMGSVGHVVLYHEPVCIVGAFPVPFKHIAAPCCIFPCKHGRHKLLCRSDSAAPVIGSSVKGYQSHPVFKHRIETVFIAVIFRVIP